MEEMALEIPEPTRRDERNSYYAGEAVNEIFDTLPDTTAGEDDDPLDKAVQALTNYFTPKQNREYEIYVFRQAKQESNESISAFHTRLRQLAVTCEFGDVDREIKTQIVQSCSSHKLRTKALENPSYTLAQLLDAGNAMELSKTQAANIEEKQSVNKLSSRNGNRSRWIEIIQTKMADVQLTRSHAPGSHATRVAKTGSQAQNAKIVAEITHIPEGKRPVPRIKPRAEAVAS